MAQVHENLRRLAGMHLVTQQRLAVALGMSRQGINNLYKGRSDPSMSTATRIAVLFGIGLDDLYADTGTCLLRALEEWDHAQAREYADLNPDQAD